MPQKSSIETNLESEDKEALGKLVASGKWTLDGLLEWLGERGYEISRSALHRHVQKVEKVASRLRESRQVTEALVAELGDAAAQGQQGRLLVEISRSLVFDMLMKLQEPGEDGESSPALSTKDVALLGKGLAEMGRALRFDQDFETKIREQIAVEERQKAASVAGKAAKKAGISEAAIKEIEETVLGLKR